MKITSIIGFIALTLSPVFSFAQEEISLYDAVVYQYSKYYPRPQSGLAFLPSGKSFIFQDEVDGKSAIMIGNSANGSSKPWFTIDQFNAWDGSEEAAKRFPSFDWQSDNEAIYSLDGQVYKKLNVSKKSVEVISDLPNKLESVSFNHNYSAYAYTENNNLFVRNLDGTMQKVTEDGGNGIVYGESVSRNEFGISGGLFWSNDGSKIAFYRKDESMVGDYPLVHIDKIPAQTEIIKYPMAGTMSENISLGIYDLKTKKTIYIKPDGDPEQYLTAVSWSKDDKSISIGILNRDQNDLDMNIYNVSDGSKLSTVFELTNDKYVEPEHGFWNLDDNRSIWLGESGSWQHAHLITKGKSGFDQLTEGRYEVHTLHAYNKATDELIFTGTGEEIVSSKFKDFSRNGTQRYTYIMSLKKRKKRILDDRIGTHSAMVSEDGNYIIEHFSSMEVPLETTLYSIDGKKIKTLYTAKDPLANIKIGKSELIEFNNSNGDMLHARLVKPSNFDPNKKYPVLVYVYGGPHAQLVRNTFNGAASLWMNWFAEQGYIVATVDNRGSANRGLEFEQATFRNLGTAEMQDQYEFMNYLKNQPWTDENKFAIHGWSFGGFMTIDMLETFPGEFTCGVAGGPVCDWNLYEVMYTERYMDTPQTNPEGFEKANLVNRASEIKDDLLVIHGTIDDVVVWQHSQQLIKSCVDNGVQIDYFIYPEHKHNVRGKDRAHLMTKILDYVSHHLED